MIAELDPLEVAFALFLATLQPADLSPWEFRLFQHYRLRRDN